MQLWQSADCSSHQCPTESEWFALQALIKSGGQLTLKAAAVHRIDPSGVQLLDAVNDGSNWRFMSENTRAAIKSDHRFRQIFTDNCGLIAGLDE